MATVVNVFQGNSTNFDARYLMSKFVPTVAVVDPDGTPRNVLDVFNPLMVAAINAMQRIGFSQYIAQQITTLTYQRYNNTTAWWMVMLISKQLHPLIIPTGAYISYPDINFILTTLAPAANSGARIPKFASI
jgi:hypothetical protein